MKNNAPRATKAEKARAAIILSLTCVYCTLAGDFRKRELENHHIVRGNKRLGHWYTLQVCAGHHRGEWTNQPIRVGISSGRHALKEEYGYDELELWQRQQVALGLDDGLPTTKVVPRRMALSKDPTPHASGGTREPDLVQGAPGIGREAS